MALFGGITLPNRPSPENVRKLDLLALPMVRRMMRFGLRIDVDRFRYLEHKLSTRMGDVRAEILNEIPPDALDKFLELADPDDVDADDDSTDEGFNVDSGVKIAELLYNVLGLHLGKVTVKKTKGGDRLSTGKKTLEQLKREHPVVPLILEYRENAKLLGNVRGMLRKAIFHPRGGECPRCGRVHYSDEYRVHTQLLTTRTATGRTASKNPNLANISGRTALGREIRAAFIASDGHVISQRDWAQIELRLMADQSRDPLMLDIYRRDGDIHIETAMRTFGIDDPAKVDKLAHRAPSKNTNFAVCYLITGAGLLDLMAVTYATAGQPLPDYMTEEWCDDFIEKWFGLYSGVRGFLDDEESIIRIHGIAWTPSGRVRRIPEVYSSLPHVQSAGVRQGSNHKIQGYSADLMKLGMGELQHRFDLMCKAYSIYSYPLMTIYDELLVETPEDTGETIQATMGDVMDNVLVDKDSGELLCRVPIRSDGKILERWTKD